jgi:hypothetical protein
MIKLVPIQTEFRQSIPNVTGNVDYVEFRNTLERINELIEMSGLDRLMMEHVLREAEKELKTEDTNFQLNDKDKERLQKTSRKALRCTLSRRLTGEAFRPFTTRLADSPLLQRFCLIDRLDVIRVPSKSTLERYEKMVPESFIRKLISQLNIKASTVKSEGEENPLKLNELLELSDLFLDTTCVKANIHFPVDWTLLKDTTRTLMKAVIIIRGNGLKNRMVEEPAEFLKTINKLSIKMTHVKRQPNGKKKRKAIFRIMKKLMKKIKVHAQRHLELLKENWQRTELKEGQVNQIVKRIEGVLEKLPRAMSQAQERIIGERLVKNKDKLLSLYEEDIHVIVRKKAGEEVEFGNTLFLAEQRDGVIVDWMMEKDQAPGDAKLLSPCLQRLEKDYPLTSFQSVTTDRGFFSKENEKILKSKGIKSYLCPRSVPELNKRLTEDQFYLHQKRRAQTEARIGIFKNNFLGRPLKSKGFISRNINVAWSILAHNLWVIARLERAEEKIKQKAA